MSIESYVSADEVAHYLKIQRRQVLALTRSGRLPAHPIDPVAARKIWRYKLSEVDAAISATISNLGLASHGSLANNLARQSRHRRG
jgi:excisionase family DNA binding protein